MASASLSGLQCIKHTSVDRQCRTAWLTHRLHRSTISVYNSSRTAHPHTSGKPVARPTPAPDFQESFPLTETPTAQATACGAEVSERHRGGWLADLAGLFGGDPVEPFTLFGTTSKKYLIEKLDGEKIVSRKRGFTVQTCVSGYSSSETSTPEFNGTATRDKVFNSPLKTCRKAEGDELKPTCTQSCSSACSEGLARYSSASDSFTGFTVPQEDKERVLRNCARSCVYECTKAGQAFDFVIPYRR